MRETLSLPLTPVDGALVRPLFVAARAEFRDDLPHTAWQARAAGIIATFYRSGKLVLEGDAARVWAERVAARTGVRVPGAKRTSATPAGSGARAPAPAAPQPPAANDPSAPPPPRPAPGAARSPYGAAVAKLPKPTPAAWIGIDETGKGDYFGPLVTVAARVSLDQLGWLEELGVGDSKAISDANVVAIAAQLRDVIPHEAVVLSPRKYNELYARFGNLNKLLAWCHAAAADALAARTDAELVLSDQFATAPLVPRYLKGAAKGLRYAQRTRAEEDPAVGCASIFARALFLSRMKALEREFGVQLHKGAGSPVLAAGRRLVRERGVEILSDVAKLHFKTTQQIT